MTTARKTINDLLRFIEKFSETHICTLKIQHNYHLKHFIRRNNRKKREKKICQVHTKIVNNILRRCFDKNYHVNEKKNVENSSELFIDPATIRHNGYQVPTEWKKNQQNAFGPSSD